MSVTTTKEGMCPYCGSYENEWSDEESGCNSDKFYCLNCGKEFFHIYEYVYSHTVGYEDAE